MNQVYNANFTTDRTSSQKQPVIDTIEELLDSDKYPLYTETDGIENFMATATVNNTDFTS